MSDKREDAVKNIEELSAEYFDDPVNIFLPSKIVKAYTEYFKEYPVDADHMEVDARVVSAASAVIDSYVRQRPYMSDEKAESFDAMYNTLIDIAWLWHEAKIVTAYESGDADG